MLRATAVALTLALACVAAASARGPMPGDRPQLRPREPVALIGVPQLVTPALEGAYVFPVFGPSSYVDAYGSDLGSDYQHGTDIYGELGQPVLAVSDGTLFSLGWNKRVGYRVSLRDHQGDLFTYGRLAAFSTEVRNGSRVRAGEVIGFMGDSGFADGASTHLHFEVHPVSLLYLGQSGAVNPNGYLRTWRRLENLAFPIATGWVPGRHGTLNVPQPGALLLGSSDIASAGLSVAKR